MRSGKLSHLMPESFENVPLDDYHIRDELVLRGEAVISYKDFEKINEEIADVDAKYKNPRNLCSGSVRQLNSEITARAPCTVFCILPGAVQTAWILKIPEKSSLHGFRSRDSMW